MLDHKLKEKKVILFGGKVEAWTVEASRTAKNTRNRIREIVDSLDLQPNPEKPVIALSLGDPTVYGNLKPSCETIQAVLDVVQEGNFNGYTNSVGHEKAREAVAQYLSHDGVEFTAKDIILCSGCSSSLDIAITALMDPTKGQNILIPRPGFSIYATLAESLGGSVKYYNLIPEQNWEIDLNHLEEQIDQNTAAIILNNPSNPCGSVYTEEHLRNVTEIAQRRRIPIIADEIYEQIVFGGRTFVSTAALQSGVPILVCGGIAKRFLVPGWRLGWIAIHDEIGAFDAEIRKGLVNLSQRTIGCNTLIQGALPRILQETPKRFHDNLIEFLERSAKKTYDGIREIRGLSPYMPEGTMYMMIEIELNRFPFKDVLSFVTKMMEEESVFCLPGDGFQIPGFMRIILTVPEDLMEEAINRMAEFCNRHYIE